MILEGLNGPMNCDIIIPVYNQSKYTKACLDSIKEHTDCQHRIIVIDDASDQETAEYLDKLSSVNEIILLRNGENQGWVKSVNKGVGFSKAEYVCVMNNDILVYPSWLSEMIGVAQKNSQIGLVNPLWELPKNFHGSRDVYFQNVIRKKQGEFIETDWARGYCFLIKRAVLDKIDGLDERYSPGYFDDWDFSLRAIQAGFIVVRAQGAFVWHYRNITYARILGKKGIDAELKRKKAIFDSRWGKFKKVLFVLDASIEDKISNVEKAALYLLRQQASLVVLKGKNNFFMNHTNCLVGETADYLLKPLVFLHLLRNTCRDLSKRYDYIVCSEDIKFFLNKFRFITGKFILKKMADLPC
jgi:glycosyltransferase involved in cell wall biosynthesis